MNRTLPLGAVRRGKRKTSFLIWAPAAERVDLRILPPDGRLIPMRRLGGGYHGVEISVIRPGALYVYRLDGLIERPDPASRSQPAGGAGPSQVCDLRPPSNRIPWRGPPLGDYIIAEPAGSHPAASEILARLDEWKAIGFTALRVPLAPDCPQQGFPPAPGFPFSVPSSLGGPADLAHLVDACHRRRLAVMLAVDLFGVGIEREPLVFFGPYFTDRSRCFNLDGAVSDEVRRFFIDCALSWFRDYRIDTLDFGAADGIADPSPLPLLEEMGLAVQSASKRAGRPLHLVGRSARNDPRLIRRREDGGIGLDALWNADFEEALLALLSGDDASATGGDFGRLEHVQKAFLEGFVCSGGYSPARRHRHGRTSRILPGERFMVRARPLPAPEDQGRGNFEARKLLVACLLLSPSLPVLLPDQAPPACTAELVRLRKKLRGLGLLDKQCMGVLGYDRQRALLLRYWKEDADLIVLFHFGTKTVRLPLPVPGGAWTLCFDSAERRWDGPGSALPGLLRGDGRDIPLRLTPLSCAVYLRKHGEQTEVEKSGS